MSLLIIGTIAFDTIETPLGRAERTVGGSCTYIGYAASYFTDKINLSAIVGGDFPKAEIKALENRGVNMEGLEIKENGRTFFWEGKYHENMNMRDTIKTDLNVLDDFEAKLPNSYKNSKFVMLGNLTPDIQKSIIDQLDGSQKLIALDTMNFWMDVAFEKLSAVISKVDLLILNDEEARQLSREYSLVKAARKIQTMGPSFVIIKKGEHGALLFGQDQIFSAPALPLSEVYDPTGAGDSFAGGVMGYLAHSSDVTYENLKKAVIYGSAMASFCVEKFSIDRLRSLSNREILSRVHKFQQISQFTI